MRLMVLRIVMVWGMRALGVCPLELQQVSASHRQLLATEVVMMLAGRRSDNLPTVEAAEESSHNARHRPVSGRSP